MMKELYTIRRLDQHQYRIVKFDYDLNVQAVYIMLRSGTKEICGCPTAQRTWCKHHEIMGLFERLNRINSGWFYDPDSKEWYQPVAMEV